MSRLAAAALLALAVLVPGPRGHAAAQATTTTAAPASREVTFRNGDVELHGTLLLPDGPGPFPAMVFLHGSGPQVRAGFEPYAREFARLGIASLYYDKRGSGESKGSWVTSSLEDLAKDAVAGVDLLETMKEIDPRRIGFWGVSQAGWVAPLAVSKAPDTAFLIVVSGGGSTPREAEMFAYRNHFKRMGLSPADTTKAVGVLDTYFRYLATGKDRDKVVAQLDEIRNGSLAPLAENLDRILPSESNQPNWSWVATYDPAAYIAQLRCPVLLVFGDRDMEQPTEVAVTRWRAALAKGGNTRATVMVFPGANHGIRIPGSGPAADLHGGPSSRAPLADGYMDVQVGWLWRNVVRPVEDGARP